MITFDAHFDGERLCPDHPVALPTNVRLRVTVAESVATEAAQEKSSIGNVPSVKDPPLGWLAQIEEEQGLIDGPTDWSAELDHYLYGTPKRGSNPDA
jgi:hypothetical protein